MKTRQRRRSPKRRPPRLECRKVRCSSSTFSVTGSRNELLVDLTELDLPSTMKTNFPDPADLLNFKLTITPDEGAR